MAKEVCGGDSEAATALFSSLPDTFTPENTDDPFFATRKLPEDWASKRPEELNCGQFVEVTRIFFGPNNGEANEPVSFEPKVWRKLKHGSA